jgi:hypothetical protein
MLRAAKSSEESQVEASCLSSLWFRKDGDAGVLKTRPVQVSERFSIGRRWLRYVVGMLKFLRRRVVIALAIDIVSLLLSH